MSDDAAAVVAMAAGEANPESLAAGKRIREAVDGNRAAAVLNQVALRRRAATKLGEIAGRLWFTSGGLEQATRWSVARWRAGALRDAGVRRVVDLGCGLGVDALACAEAGIEVVAVERDPVTAVLARANLRDRGQVLVGPAEDLAGELLADREAAVFVDPARRTARGRTWEVADLSPSWEFVSELLASGRVVVAKLGPGIPDSLLPEGAAAVWVSDGGDLVECSLWTPGAGPGGLAAGTRAACLLPGEHTLLATRAAAAAPRPPLPGDFLYEPDPAVIRAGGADDLARTLEAGRVAHGVPYLVARQLVTTPFAAAFQIAQVLPWDERVIRRWVEHEDIGTLEIKKRAITLDPATLRKRLRPRGRRAATIVITPTASRAACLVVQRV